MDSLGTAAVLAHLARQGLMDVTAVHVDHRMRPGSDDEQRLVAAQAEDLHLPFRDVTLPLALRNVHPGLGWEEAARRERYVALASVAHDTGATIIALGHHASDQAETVLLHLMRGSGLRGVSGMREWSERPIPWWSDTDEIGPFWVWRPLLSETKATIEAFVVDLAVDPIDDPSNRSATFTRNRVRHEIVPSMQLISPGASAAIGRFAEVVGSEDDYLGLVTEAALVKLTADDGGLAASELLAEHRAIQRRVVRAWLASATREDFEVSQDRVDAVLTLARANIGGRVIEIASGWNVSFSRGRLCRYRTGKESPGG